MGWFSEAGDGFCTECPPGEECPTITAPGTPCAPGTYSTGGWQACKSCPQGHMCPDPTVLPEICAKGINFN